MTKLWSCLIAVLATFIFSSAHAATFTFSSTVQVSGLTKTIPGPPDCSSGQCFTPITVFETRWISALPFNFADQPYGLVERFTSVSLTLTIFDGDTGPTDFDRNHLFIYFNNINARWWANGFADDQTVTQTLVNPLTAFTDTWPLIEESFRQQGTIYVGLLDDTPETPNDLSFASSSFPIATLTITAELTDVPEPASIVLLGSVLGLVGIGRWRGGRR